MPPSRPWPATAALASHSGHCPDPDAATQRAGDPEAVAPEPAGEGARDTWVEVGESEPDEPECGDLALNRPGAAAREQVNARLRAATVTTMLGRLLGVHTEERAWRIGAVGEQAAAKRPDRLGEGWHVLHAIQVGDKGSDIDHIAIGPGGGSTINAKHRPSGNVWVVGDVLLVNGRRRPYVRNSRYEARRASSPLSAQVGRPVTVIGVIAVIGATRGSTVKQQPEDGPSWWWPVARWTGGFVAGPPSSTLARWRPCMPRHVLRRPGGQGSWWPKTGRSPAGEPSGSCRVGTPASPDRPLNWAEPGPARGQRIASRPAAMAADQPRFDGASALGVVSAPGTTRPPRPSTRPAAHSRG